MRRRSVLLGMAGALTHTLPARACSLALRTRVPVEIAGGAPVVEVLVNGRTARMVLDTGAQRTLVDTNALQRLDLDQDNRAAATVRGIGGTERNRVALPRSLSLGGIPLARRTLEADTSLTVGALARPTAGGQRVDGLLGRDLLAAFDLDLDLPARSLGLHAVTECRAVAPPWTGSYTTLPMQTPMDSAIQLAVEIDGLRLRALLDSGAVASIITAPGMARLAVPEALLEQDRKTTISGLGPRQIDARLHRFRNLRLGDIVIDDPRILMAPIQTVPIVDLLLGNDFLLTRRTWISFATRQLHIARA